MISHISERLTALRREISRAGLDAFIVPRTDEYQSEYISPSAERVAYLSGFTGSAATLIILKDKAAFFTDGRYTLQAARQVPQEWFSRFDTADKTPTSWLEENAEKGSRIGYDPWLHSVANIERLKKSLIKAGAEAVPVARNLVDLVWNDRPPPPAAPVYPYEISYAGKTSAEKRQEIAAALKKKNLAAAILADAASVAWILNIRGGDVLNTPLPLSRAILNDTGAVEWFVDAGKVKETLLLHLGGQITVSPPENFSTAVVQLAHSGNSVLLDPSRTPCWIADALRAAKGKIEQGEDPCALPRAIKNATELKGIRAAHVRDGAALTNFLAWLDGRWEKERVTELDAERKLEAFRAANADYRGPSFETISAAGEHGAIVHYRATEESNAPLLAGQLYLLDSGGQYIDGTTDVTRTMALGKPLAEMRENFTRVLKGHIAIASIRFPEGTSGADLDVLARQYLWAVGKDYSHGTGHGVGCYLGVHEGPQGFSKRSPTPLVPGMILSNEPGFYKEGHYGIRLENLVEVVEIAALSKATRKIFGFETLTLAPIDRHLIDVSLLTDADLVWLNAYHQRVRETLRPLIEEAAKPWLETATENMGK
jgi:Xaa-Pro aminopeptidase